MQRTMRQSKEWYQKNKFHEEKMHSFLWIVVGFHAGLTYIQHWYVQEKEMNHVCIKNRSKNSTCGLCSRTPVLLVLVQSELSEWERSCIQGFIPLLSSRGSFRRTTSRAVALAINLLDKRSEMAVGKTRPPLNSVGDFKTCKRENLRAKSLDAV